MLTVSITGLIGKIDEELETSTSSQVCSWSSSWASFFLIVLHSGVFVVFLFRISLVLFQKVTDSAPDAAHNALVWESLVRKLLARAQVHRWLKKDIQMTRARGSRTGSSLLVPNDELDAAGSTQQQGFPSLRPLNALKLSRSHKLSRLAEDNVPDAPVVVRSAPIRKKTSVKRLDENSGFNYYENLVTGETSWEKPDDASSSCSDDGEEPPPPAKSKILEIEV
jgi:hypothetical protein